MPGKLGWRADLKQRLMYRVKKTDSCWIWVGPVDYREGFKPYGRMWKDGTTVVAHRVSWQVYRGPIPRGMLVLHHCDNASCVNPDHLFLGTYRDNTQDMMQKNRDAGIRESRRGEKNNFAKLTADQVKAIRADPGSDQDVAHRYGVTRMAITKIRSRENWKHIA